MSAASIAACAASGGFMAARDDSRCSRWRSFWLTIARTCGISAVLASVISSSTNTRWTARATSASYASAVSAPNVVATVIDEGRRGRAATDQRVLFDDPGRALGIEEKPSVKSAATTAGVIASNI